MWLQRSLNDNQLSMSHMHSPLELIYSLLHAYGSLTRICIYIQLHGLLCCIDLDLKRWYTIPHSSRFLRRRPALRFPIRWRSERTLWVSMYPISKVRLTSRPQRPTVFHSPTSKLRRVQVRQENSMSSIWTRLITLRQRLSTPSSTRTMLLRLVPG